MTGEWEWKVKSIDRDRDGSTVTIRRNSGELYEITFKDDKRIHFEGRLVSAETIAVILGVSLDFVNGMRQMLRYRIEVRFREIRTRLAKRFSDVEEKKKELEQHARKIVAECVLDLYSHEGFYETPPRPICTSKEITKIPNVSGVYFIWRGGRVVYVGESINIRHRTCSHERIEPGDMLSWVYVDKHGRKYAEAYYIGILRPPLNFNIARKRNDEKACIS